MPPNRTAALALVTGSAAGILTMVLHPTGHDVVSNATAGVANTLTTAVHALAIVAQPLVIAGALYLTLQFRVRRDVAVGAFVFYACAGIAVMLAAAASGFISPEVVDGLAGAAESERTAMMSMLHFTGILNQTFAKIHVAFSSIAIAGWSYASLQERALPRGVAVYGLVLAATFVAGILTGHLRLDIHGFGAVVLAEAIWMALAATWVWRVSETS